MSAELSAAVEERRGGVARLPEGVAAPEPSLRQVPGDLPHQRRPTELVPDERPTVGRLLAGYLTEHLARLEDQDQRLRSGDSGGVHQLRVAARRLRSALTTYGPVLAPQAASDLRAELRWIGGVLSPARDAQVLGRRLDALLDEEPSDLVVGPVRDRIHGEMAARFHAGTAEAEVALASGRYVRLLRDLKAFVDSPPFTAAARADARDVVPDLVQAELDRLRRRDRDFRRAATPGEHDLALHDVRKAAKRLRYAAETCHPVLRRATRLAARAEALQELLGEHQDSVVGRATLREIGARAAEAGESAFTYGRLHVTEAHRAQSVERRYPHVLAALPHQELARWLRA